MKIYTFFMSSSDFFWLYYSELMHNYIEFELYHVVKQV